MSRTSLGWAVAGIAAVGATVFYASHSIQNRPLASLKEKEKQTAEKIKKLVEDENETQVKVPVARNKSKGGQGSAISAGALVGGSGGEGGNSNFCSAAEYVGSGPEEVQLDLALWSQFMGEYHAAKADLLQWVAANKGHFAESAVQQMEAEIRATRVMRPQNQIETDLTWRGIASWTRPRSGASETEERPALIHVGSGFMKLFQNDRSRARFEIARLLAQSWSPCEMGASQGAQVWKDYFACMGITEDQLKCSPGVVSEATWAISTAVAALVAKPGCEVPAFNQDAAQCLKPFHRGDVASFPVEPVSRKIASSKEK
jgi:hypothetical protein